MIGYSTAVFFTVGVSFSLLLAGCLSPYRLPPLEDYRVAVESQVADPYSWDFGQVKAGEVVKHRFSLKNDTAKTMNIKGTYTSCGCTASTAGKKTLYPGESTFLEVNFNSTGYLGAVQQFVYVNTDSLDKPVLRFIIKAEVTG